ncbi:THUMP domain-containing class I SAM-dependent RNA methyltransferase [Eoetvoesiella caeni]
MTESDKTRKTLTLSKRASAPNTEASDNKPKRAGARARQVAQLERERAKQRALQEASDNGTREDANRRPAPAPVADSTAYERAPGARSARPASRGAAAPAADARPRRQTRDSEPPHETVAPRIKRRTAAPRSRKEAEIFAIFAPCPQGLEEALAAELQELGFEDAQPGRAGCHFHADWSGMQRANLYSRLATRILLQVAHGAVHHEDDILELARQTPWERWFGPEQTLRVDTSAIRSPMQSLQYCNLRAKDGICDRLRELEGARPDIDTVRPDARVHLFLTEDSATLYLDTSGESLFKRGWRLDKGDAPIRENLAAGILALSDWDPSQPLLDPFCGSGTILIEAAWIALGVPAGIWRPFSFERLRDHDARHWRDLKDDARAHIRTQLESPLVGVDLNPAAIEAARQNVERAWLTPDSIRFEVGDARHTPAPAPTGWLITNPPYGERMETDDTEMWRAWAQNLKQNFSGWQVGVITSDLSLPQKLRLKPKRRYPLYNGALDCRLFSFEMVEAGYRR